MSPEQFQTCAVERCFGEGFNCSHAALSVDYADQSYIGFCHLIV